MVHFIRFDAARRKIPHEIGGSTTLRIGNRVYVLTGVLVHEGESATSGHYYCDVVCPPHEQTGLAYQCNDAAYPSLIEEELGDDFRVAYMHIYELETGNEAAPIANTLGSDTRKRKSGENLTTAEKQRRRSGLQANEEGHGLPATSEEEPISEEKERRNLKTWVEEEERIRNIKVAERSKEEKRGLKWLQKRINKVKDRYPDAEVQRLVEQQRTGGLQANSKKGDGTPIGNCTGSISTSEEQQRRGGLPANVEEQGLPATSDEQQRIGGLQANNDARNGKLIGNCRGSIPSTVKSCTEEDEGRRRLKGWVEEKKRIHSMEPAERSKEEEKRKKWLTEKIKEVKDDYPDIDTKMPSKAKKGAERKLRYRGGQSEEEKEQVKADDRRRKEAERLAQSEEEREQVKANDRRRKEAERLGKSEVEKAVENESAKMRMTEHRQRQSEEEKEQVKADDRRRKETERLGQSEEEKEQAKIEARQRMTAKRAKVASKPKDGLNAQMTLVGSFRVDTNHLGAMDEVS